MVLVLGRPSEFREAKEDPGDAAASLLLVLFKIIFDQCNLGDVVKEKETLGPSMLFNRYGRYDDDEEEEGEYEDDY